MYEIFEHTADLGLRVQAGSLDGLFVDAAVGLTSMIVANLDAVQPVQERELMLESEQIDFLLFDWLTELIYCFECESMVCCEFDVRVESNTLKANVRGEQVDPARHHLEHEVKAITYHGLKVEQQPDGWLAEVIVDI